MVVGSRIWVQIAAVVLGVLGVLWLAHLDFALQDEVIDARKDFANEKQKYEHLEDTHCTCVMTVDKWGRGVCDFWTPDKRNRD